MISINKYSMQYKLLNSIEAGLPVTFIAIFDPKTQE